MRTVFCDDDAFVRLVGNGELYDYELGERYIVAPAAGGDHADLQMRIGAALHAVVTGARVFGPCNLGVLGEAGERWYVVPDAAILPPGTPRGQDAFLHALVAVEIRSRRERVATKLAAYREVAERTGLVVDEVWYVDGDTVTVHARAADEPGETRFADAFATVAAAVAAFAAEA